MKYKLQQILTDSGFKLINEPEKLIKLIKNEFAGKKKKLLNIIELTLLNGMAKEIKELEGQNIYDVRLVLIEDYGIVEELADWVIDTWYFVFFNKNLNWADEDFKELDEIEPEMIFIKGGSFLMGGYQYDDEKPIHEVKLNDFYLSKYVITKQLWDKTLLNKSVYKNQQYLPAEKKWNEIQKYINKLNIKTNKNYRLPTEAEWEYAAKGGELSKGNIYSGSNIIQEVGWVKDNSDNEVHPVGCKKANELGLYDMTGNVWEWCSDWYDENYYVNSTGFNAKGPAEGEYKVLRGGSYLDIDKNCCVSVRFHYNPATGSFGFRLVLDKEDLGIYCK